VVLAPGPSRTVAYLDWPGTGRSGAAGEYTVELYAGVRSLDPGYQALFDALLEALEWADPAYRPPLERDEQEGMRVDVYRAFAGDDPEWRVGGAIAAFDPPLAALRAPALVITGRWDRLTSPRLALATAEALPGARLEILEESGHRPWAEQPERYFDLVERFLDERA
jgi:proline iminopeptidase